MEAVLLLGLRLGVLILLYTIIDDSNSFDLYYYNSRYVELDKQNTEDMDIEKISTTPITLSQYRELVAQLTKPSLLQMQEFAEYVSHLHSWYKHLPLLPPGVPFQFFLNPTAGMDLITGAEGTIHATARAEAGHRFLPTTEYRERFGYLACSRSRGTFIAPPNSRLITQFIESDNAVFVFDPDTQSVLQLPEVVIEAGSTFISGIVHTFGANHHLWREMIFENILESIEESEGLLSIAKIRDRCRFLQDNPSQVERLAPDALVPKQDPYLTSVDFPLYQILEPERQRQRAGMVEAMKRVIEMVY